DASPAARPWSIERPTMYSTAGPGMTSSVSAASTNSPYAVGDGTLASVQRRELAARLREPLAQRDGLEHLELRAEPQQLAIGVAEVLERDDGAPVLVDARLAGQPPAQVRIDAHDDLDARQTLLERTRPVAPERRELEL